MSHAGTPSSDAAAPPSELLRVSQIRVCFGGIVALDDVSFGIETGQIAGLIGPNGAGKTTLFNCLSRLYEYEHGTIVFDGTPLSAVARHRIAALGIGRTFQNLALFGTMSVLDNVMVGRHCRTSSGFAANALQLPRVWAESLRTRERARELVEFLDLDSVARAAACELPLAVQKRVELARALASDPKLLLLDEPASGLNHQEAAALGRLILEIRDRLRITVLLVEHRMNLVMSICDKVVALNFGRKIADGTPEQVRTHPDVIQAYLGTTA
ncbi:MAG TPA: ABC transporter ATP-binding protein [Burkholderiaceae bacterium]|nr:ABC transporter ATP-binding protein [Burkholderiaceae bacterium]